MQLFTLSESDIVVGADLGMGGGGGRGSAGWRAMWGSGAVDGLERNVLRDSEFFLFSAFLLLFCFVFVFYFPPCFAGQERWCCADGLGVVTTVLGPVQRSRAKCSTGLGVFFPLSTFLLLFFSGLLFVFGFVFFVSFPPPALRGASEGAVLMNLEW